MPDITIRFPDGSTKTYPESMPQEEIRADVQAEMGRRVPAGELPFREAGDVAVPSIPVGGVMVPPNISQGILSFLGIDSPSAYANREGGVQDAAADLLRAAGTAGSFAVPGAGLAGVAGRAAAGALPTLAAEFVEGGDLQAAGEEQAALTAIDAILSGLSNKMVRPAIEVGGALSGARGAIMKRGKNAWESTVDALERLATGPLRLRPNPSQRALRAAESSAGKGITSRLSELDAMGATVDPVTSAYEGARKHIEGQVQTRAMRSTQAQREAAEEAADIIAGLIGRGQPGDVAQREVVESLVRPEIASRLMKETIPRGVGDTVQEVARMLGDDPFRAFPSTVQDITSGASEMGQRLSPRIAQQAAGKAVEGIGESATEGAIRKEMREELMASDPDKVLSSRMRDFSDVAKAREFSEAVRRDPAFRMGTGAMLGSTALGYLLGSTGAGMAIGAPLGMAVMDPNLAYRLLVDAPAIGARLTPGLFRLGEAQDE